ncbi:MAG: phage gp6-like head-tail connector protein [Oscillibacter sp.]|nr:phage gp6-like head-tail connector protein [Oscillibacter sp.]MBQ7778793.1 phage gp6-like head-tail connector protein [Oscillibacter sp.]
MAWDEGVSAALMNYCRIDELIDGDGDDLREAYESAVAYMAAAGVREPERGSERYAQWMRCIKALVLDDWDNRGTQTAGQALADNLAFRRRLNQLKLTEPVSDSDTGAGE